MTRSDLSWIINRAAQGDRESLRELKTIWPRREFRRFWCDIHGHVVKWRAKGSKAVWKRLYPAS